MASMQPSAVWKGISSALSVPIRTVKNMSRNEVEVAVRDATSMADSEVSGELINKVVEIAEHEETFLTVFDMLWRRFKDIKQNMHVYKAIVLLKALLTRGQSAERFRRECLKPQHLHDIALVSRTYSYANISADKLAIRIKSGVEELQDLLTAHLPAEQKNALRNQFRSASPAPDLDLRNIGSDNFAANQYMDRAHALIGDALGPAKPSAVRPNNPRAPSFNSIAAAASASGAGSSSSSPTTTNWTCSFCSTANAPRSDQCVNCARSRAPTSSPSTLSVTSLASVSSTKLWSCPKCTFENQESFSVCDVCHMPKPVPGKWHCPNCTLANDLSHDKCDACGRTNPSTAQPARHNRTDSSTGPALSQRSFSAPSQQDASPVSASASVDDAISAMQHRSSPLKNKRSSSPLPPIDPSQFHVRPAAAKPNIAPPPAMNKAGRTRVGSVTAGDMLAHSAGGSGGNSDGRVSPNPPIPSPVGLGLPMASNSARSSNSNQPHHQPVQPPQPLQQAPPPAQPQRPSPNPSPIPPSAIPLDDSKSLSPVSMAIRQHLSQIHNPTPTPAPPPPMRLPMQQQAQADLQAQLQLQQQQLQQKHQPSSHQRDKSLTLTAAALRPAALNPSFQTLPTPMSNRGGALTLHEVLNDPVAHNAFLHFCELDFTENLVLFWDAIQEYERVQDKQQRMNKGREIWTEFLHHNAPRHIDFEESIVKEIARTAKQVSPSLFREAGNEVIRSLRLGSFQRFSQTAAYLEAQQRRELRSGRGNAAAPSSNRGVQDNSVSPRAPLAHSGSAVKLNTPTAVAASEAKLQPAPKPSMPSAAANVAGGPMVSPRRSVDPDVAEVFDALVRAETVSGAKLQSAAAAHAPPSDPIHVLFHKLQIPRMYADVFVKEELEVDDLRLLTPEEMAELMPSQDSCNKLANWIREQQQMEEAEQKQQLLQQKQQQQQQQQEEQHQIEGGGAPENKTPLLAIQGGHVMVRSPSQRTVDQEAKYRETFTKLLNQLPEEEQKKVITAPAPLAHPPGGTPHPPPHPPPHPHYHPLPIGPPPSLPQRPTVPITPSTSTSTTATATGSTQPPPLPPNAKIPRSAMPLLPVAAHTEISNQLKGQAQAQQQGSASAGITAEDFGSAVLSAGDKTSSSGASATTSAVVSSTSSSLPVSPAVTPTPGGDDDLDQMSKRLIQRLRVEQEILDSERTYTNHLKTLVTRYVHALTDKDYELARSLGLTPQDVMAIFSNLDSIYQFHTIFLMDLEADPTAPESVFVKHSPFFKIYTQYVACYDTALQTITRLSQNRKWQGFLDSQRSASAGAGQSLDLVSYLIMPIQRVPRYELLLRELQKNTESISPHYAAVQTALALMNKSARLINERKRQAENMSEMLNMQLRISGLPADKTLCIPTRRLVRHGVLKYKSRGLLGGLRPCMAILFNDAFVYTTPAWKFKGWIDLRNSVCHDFEQDDTHFSIISKEETLTLVCEDQSEKHSWMREIQDWLAKCKQRARRTSTVVMGGDDMSHDDDVFGAGDSPAGGGPGLMHSVTSISPFGASKSPNLAPSPPAPVQSKRS